MPGMGRGIGLALMALALGGCGARSALEDDPFLGRGRPDGGPERCNGFDEDGDGDVDEDFRDSLGRYVHPDHCGECGAACPAPVSPELAISCGLIEESPVCVATECERGFGPSLTGRCVPAWDHLCLTCADDGDCGDLVGARCADLGGEPRCTIECETLGCAEGYGCTDGACVPQGGSCWCDPGERFDVACALVDPEGLRCVGSATCDDGDLSECVAPDEVCNHTDEDCDGVIDEGFADARGAYILDIHNCGECGVDCTVDEIPEGDLICGGDPFAPQCVLDCPDARDGIMPGDRVDADREIATGCECTVTAIDDVPGPVRAVDETLDVNCDGADGIVIRSYYVAPDGADTNPGSPTRPLQTIGEALRRAGESVGMPSGRTHVYVASGRYTETLELPDGVQLHGGYRRDFRALDPTGFRVEVRAPADTTAPGGAALVARGAGATETVVEWMALRGIDATAASQPAFGVYIEDGGRRLSLRELEIRSGVAGEGMDGMHGLPGAGAGAMAEPEAGGEPRGAREDFAHVCIPGPDNTVAGGAGGRNTCDGADVGGGTGGSPSCPSFAMSQPPGAAGRGTGGGSGGAGGMDSRGPITGSSCTRPVCCGLADYQVPTEFMGPQPGGNGADGTGGTAGRGCTEPLGRFDAMRWVGEMPTMGTGGTPGRGGGGGGAGGGNEMEWFDDGECGWPDGLGGGGGGGGAGGCGGRPGTPGTSGAPSVAVLVRGGTAPELRDNVIQPRDGGRGGDGGAGGDGALGDNGAFGGDLTRAERSTPTLAGPFPGGRGGRGGNGGPGGGAGGGCGGGSVGVWLTGAFGTPPDTGAIRAGNTFMLGRGGEPGRGGGGGAAAADGAAGGAVDVVLR